MKKILIIGTVPDSILEENLKKLSILLKKNKYKYFLLRTKSFKNGLIDEIIPYNKKNIDLNDRMELNKYDKIFVCQMNNDFFSYINIYLFLKKNNIEKFYIINKFNKIKLFKSEKITFWVEFFIKIVPFYYNIEKSR